jgi:hypothetical protein
VNNCLAASLCGRAGNIEVDSMVSTPPLRVLKGDLLHKLTARAVIRDWKDGALATSESEQEAKKRLVSLRVFALLCSVHCATVSRRYLLCFIQRNSSKHHRSKHPAQHCDRADQLCRRRKARGRLLALHKDVDAFKLLTFLIFSRALAAPRHISSSFSSRKMRI